MNYSCGASTSKPQTRDKVQQNGEDLDPADYLTANLRKKACGLELQWKTGICMLNTALCHFCNAGLILVLILGWAVFYSSGFFAISVLSFSCCTANNNLLCFCDLFCSTKTKTYECEAIQKHNELHAFAQKITGNRKTAFLHQDCWIMFRSFHWYQKGSSL